jgi:4-hydroxy-3-methylbut-2-enyl diphosphate reductase IspH
VKQKRDVVEGPGWLGDARNIGITAGASTPNNKIGETIARVAATVGISIETLLR